MAEEQRSAWKRAVAIVGLLSLLCFWTAAAAHVHSAARQDGVQQDCPLCVAGATSHTLQPSVSASFTILPLSESLLCTDDLLPHDHAQRTFPSRAPPSHA